ncbi:MAG TPA: hypothetical protein VH643_01435 [Gemmataceae bacterium]
MRRLGALVGCSVVVLSLVVLTASSACAAKDPKVADEVVVLLKLYRNSFEAGKYQQAEEFAQLAHQLAPEDPETTAALRAVRVQQTRTPPVNTEQLRVAEKLDKVLNKMEQLEKHVRELEMQKTNLERQLRVLRTQNQQSSRAPRREPLGSPDRID